MPPTHEPTIAERALLPPHAQRPGFLPADMAAGLLDHILAHEHEFRPSQVVGYENGVVDPTKRISLVLADLGPFATPLRDRLSALQDELVAELKVTPFRTARIELQIAAHGDGAFFRRHRDLARPGDRPRKTRRVMSGVYYLHAIPKAFGGGAFRLHEVLPRGDVAQHLDIEPQHNAAIFFPAWMPHEVTPVSCPSRRFADFRFAINCWYHEAI